MATLLSTTVNGTLYATALYDAGSRVAISRGEGRDYINYSRYVYNNGAYSGTGWIEPSDLGVRYANSAGSTTFLNNVSNYSWSSSTLPTSYSQGLQLSFVGPSAGEGSWQNYGTVLTARTYSGGGGSLQMYVPYGPSNGGDSLQVRFGNYSVSSGNSWTGWKTLIDSGTIGSQSVNYANSAGSVAWGNVSGRPTALSSFTNDLGNYGGFLTSLPSHNHDDRYYTETEINNFSYWRNDEARTIKTLFFTGVGGDSGNTSNHSYAIYQGGGGWSHPYPDLHIGYHTGIKIGANTGYGGIRFYSDSDMATELFSVGNGNSDVRVSNNLAVGGTITGSNLSGTNTGDQTNISGNAATATNVAASGITGQTGMWTSAARPGAYRLYRNDDNSAYNVQTTWSADVSGYWSLRGYNGDTYHAACYVGYSGYASSAGSVAWDNVTSKPGIYLHNTWHGNVYLGTGGDIYCTILYDSNNSGYYLDPNSTSRLNRTNYDYVYSYNWVYAEGDVIAFYSDERLKTRVGTIENALDKIKQLTGFYYVNNDLAKSFGYKDEKLQVGLSAQEVQSVLPEVVTLAPFDTEFDENNQAIGSKSGESYLTVSYDKLVPLLIESIKEQQLQIEELKSEVKKLKGE